MKNNSHKNNNVLHRLRGGELPGPVRMGLASSTGVMLGLAMLYPALFVLSWVAFVPLLIALRRATIGQAYGLGTLAGLALFVLCSHWMTDFLILLKGYSFLKSTLLAALYWLYSAQQLALLAVLTAILGRRFSLLWAFPLVVTVMFALFPSLFSGQVGETQSLFLAALQGTSMVGVHGLDFVVGLVNILLLRALSGTGTADQMMERSLPLAYLLVFGWFSYGVITLAQWDNKVSQWNNLTVGIVQPHQPPGVGKPEPPPAYSRSWSVPMALSDALLQQPVPVDLLLWPELRSQEYFAQPYVRDALQRRVTQWQTALVFQDTERVRGAIPSARYNASVLLDDRGQARGRYNKMKRVPLAEYLPLLGDYPAAKAWMRRWLGQFFGDYNAGNERVAFDLDGLTLAPLICYEVMFPQFVAGAMPRQPLNQPTLLLAQSNNGWFGETRQPYEHLHASALRSVENRLPMVHAVNNGPSAVVLPSGRMTFRSDYHQRAAYAVEVPVGNKKEGSGSFYSRYPWIFTSICYLALGLMLLRCWWVRR